MSKSKAKCWSCGDTGSSAIRDCPYCEEIELADLRAKLAAATERAEKAELAVQEQRLITETVRAGMQSLGRTLEDCRLDKHAVEVERDALKAAVEKMYADLRFQRNDRDHWHREEGLKAVKLAEAVFDANKAEAQLVAAFADLRRDQKVAKELRTCVTDANARAEAAEAELTAARAGEARALEALRKIRTEVHALIEQSTGVAGLHLNGDEAEWSSLLAGGEYESWLMSLDETTDAQPALDWLAQQRRDAVAEELERMCSENEERYGTHFMEMTTDCLRDRAAELRKGKGE